MSFVTNPIGLIGESEAAKMLEKKGFKVVERNWRMGHLEVDLIAEGRKEIVFVEVKARTSTFGNIMPEEYVDEDKRRKITAAANAYIKYKKTDKTLRFDVIGILVDPDTHEVTYRGHWESAYAPQIRTITTNSFSGQCNWGNHHKLGKRYKK